MYKIILNITTFGLKSNFLVLYLYYKKKAFKRNKILKITS